MKKYKEPPKWTDVYPQGTKEGDEEQAFFIALTRTKWDWRSTAALAKEAKITRERVDEIISKYYELGMLFQNPSNDDQWGYWERCKNFLPEEEKSITELDHNTRIKKAIDKMNCQ